MKLLMQLLIMMAQGMMVIVGGAYAAAVSEYLGAGDGVQLFVFFSGGFITSYVVTILVVRTFDSARRRLLRQQPGEDFGP